MPSKLEVGIVTSDKAAKTRRVEIPRLVKDQRYGKYLRRKTVCTVHDENNESHTGDTVEIAACRPLSRTKRWKLVRIVEKGRGIDLAALRAEARGQEVARLEEAGIHLEESGAAREEVDGGESS